MSCTVPKLFGIQEWFDARFSDLCQEHDNHYEERVWATKWVSDFYLAEQFAVRGYIVLAFMALAYTSTFGTAYWMWKKYK